MTPQEHAVIGEMDEMRERNRRNTQRLKLAQKRAEERRMAHIRDEQTRLRAAYYARQAAA